MHVPNHIIQSHYMHTSHRTLNWCTRVKWSLPLWQSPCNKTPYKKQNTNTYKHLPNCVWGWIHLSTQHIYGMHVGMYRNPWLYTMIKIDVKSLTSSAHVLGEKTTTPSRIPIRTNPHFRKSTPVHIDVVSSAPAISIDHISNNDNKSKSIPSPLQLQAIQ